MYGFPVSFRAQTVTRPAVACLPVGRAGLRQTAREMIPENLLINIL